jgi:AAA+ superfamily predicted ATPase
MMSIKRLVMMMACVLVVATCTYNVDALKLQLQLRTITSITQPIIDGVMSKFEQNQKSCKAGTLTQRQLYEATLKGYGPYLKAEVLPLWPSSLTKQKINMMHTVLLAQDMLHTMDTPRSLTARAMYDEIEYCASMGEKYIELEKLDPANKVYGQTRESFRLKADQWFASYKAQKAKEQKENAKPQAHHQQMVGGAGTPQAKRQALPAAKPVAPKPAAPAVRPAPAPGAVRPARAPAAVVRPAPAAMPKPAAVVVPSSPVAPAPQKQQPSSGGDSLAKILQAYHAQHPTSPKSGKDDVNTLRQQMLTQGVITAPVDKSTGKTLDLDSMIGKEGRETKELFYSNIFEPLMQSEAQRKAYGIQAEKGCVLFGPPGNGKTYTVQLLAADAAEKKVVVLEVKATWIKNEYIGASGRLVNAMFDVINEIKQLTQKPVIVFIDEVDLIMTARGGEKESEPLKEIKQAFLTSLTDESISENIFFIGATNFPDILDPALTRQGRLGTKIYLKLPDAENRRHIMNNVISKLNSFSGYSVVESRPNEISNYVASKSENWSVVELTTVGDKVKNTAYARVKAENKTSLAAGNVVVAKATLQDFVKAVQDIERSRVKPDLSRYERFNTASTA